LLIAQVLDMGGEFAGPAEDIIFSWLITLPPEIDPATAANQLLEDHSLRAGPVPDGPIGRLWTLLRETAAYPDDRLQSAPRRRRLRH
jgi:hypothetical protein